MNEITYSIRWQIIRVGQLRLYADSIYEYRIESELHENLIKNFCIKVLRPCSIEGRVGTEQFDGSCSFPHGLQPYYRFRKIEENIYEYVVCEPFTD